MHVMATSPVRSSLSMGGKTNWLGKGRQPRRRPARHALNTPRRLVDPSLLVSVFSLATATMFDVACLRYWPTAMPAASLVLAVERLLSELDAGMSVLAELS